jgi:hypothetical protein
MHWVIAVGVFVAILAGGAICLRLADAFTLRRFVVLSFAAFAVSVATNLIWWRDWQSIVFICAIITIYGLSWLSLHNRMLKAERDEAMSPVARDSELRWDIRNRQ